VNSLPEIRVEPVSSDIAVLGGRLAEPMHADPAERLIVATPCTLSVPLMTGDKKLQDYRGVEEIWCVGIAITAGRLIASRLPPDMPMATSTRPPVTRRHIGRINADSSQISGRLSSTACCERPRSLREGDLQG
jgi:hypothetical protein